MSNAKKKQTHATQSFSQMMSQAQLNALKPYIQDQVSGMGQVLLQQIAMSAANDRLMFQTRQMAFERLLRQHMPWFTEDSLALAVADVEDESSGFVTVDEGAQEGDKVRLTVTSKGSAQADFGESHKLVVHSLLTKDAAGKVQTLNSLETNLVGAKAGETKEFLLPEPAEEGKEPEHTRVKATVIRVSRKAVTESK